MPFNLENNGKVPANSLNFFTSEKIPIVEPEIICFRETARINSFSGYTRPEEKIQLWLKTFLKFWKSLG